MSIVSTIDTENIGSWFETCIKIENKLHHLLVNSQIHERSQTINLKWIAVITPGAVAFAGKLHIFETLAK